MAIDDRFDARGGDEVSGVDEAGGPQTVPALLASDGRLRTIVDEASARGRDDRARFRLALVYPAAISVLAVIGTLWTTATNDRLIRDLEDSFRDPPLPTAAPAWPGLGPMGLALLVAGLAVAAGMAARIMHLRLAVGRHAGQAARCDVLAELAGHSDGSLAAADRERLVDDVVAAIDPPVPASTSPIAACAEAQDDLDGRVATLRAAASFFRTLEERQRQRARLLLPTMGCLIAGLVVLCYGVALFRPMAGLLDAVAAPHDVIGGGGSP